VRTTLLLQKFNGKDHLLNLDADRRLILMLILKISAVMLWTGFIWLTKEPMVGLS
jgi:hypothetical protein